jgi:DNA-binding transcriptional MocR family regulator
MTLTAPDSLSEQIAQHLAERIIRGELKARERIQEQKVTQALNVSREVVLWRAQLHAGPGDPGRAPRMTAHAA